MKLFRQQHGGIALIRGENDLEESVSKEQTKACSAFALCGSIDVFPECFKRTIEEQRTTTKLIAEALE